MMGDESRYSVNLERKREPMIVKADSGRQMRLVRKRENGLGVTTTADKRCELQKLALQYQEQEFSVIK